VETRPIWVDSGANETYGRDHILMRHFDVRRERQLEGIAMAMRQGVYKGGKARLDRQRVRELSSRAMGPASIARELGMARSAVYRLLREASASRSGHILRAVLRPTTPPVLSI
jgi:DNA-binding phage protein